MGITITWKDTDLNPFNDYTYQEMVIFALPELLLKRLLIFLSPFFNI